MKYLFLTPPCKEKLFGEYLPSLDLIFVNVKKLLKADKNIARALTIILTHEHIHKCLFEFGIKNNSPFIERLVIFMSHYQYMNELGAEVWLKWVKKEFFFKK